MSETMSAPENPQAFPNAWEETNAHGVTFPYVERGMTLRDYFAGQALAGIFAHPTTPHQNATDVGAYCYAMADAMLTARKGADHGRG